MQPAEGNDEAPSLLGVDSRQPRIERKQLPVNGRARPVTAQLPRGAGGRLLRKVAQEHVEVLEVPNVPHVKFISLIVEAERADEMEGALQVVHPRLDDGEEAVRHATRGARDIS